MPRMQNLICYKHACTFLTTGESEAAAEIQLSDKKKRYVWQDSAGIKAPNAYKEHFG